MATASWLDFRPYVAPDVYECPDMTVEVAVRDAAIEFCRRTHAWRVALDPIMTEVGVHTYPLSLSSSTLVEHVVDVVFGTQRLTPAKPEDLSPYISALSSAPRVYSVLASDQVRVYPTPNSVGELKVIVAVTPSSSSTGIDTGIFERFKEVIAHGAKHRLMSVPQKSWSNPQMAQYHFQRFMLGISEAKIRLDHNMSNRVYNRRFA